VKFEDGSEETGSLVIGCDGGRSKVRVSLVGADAAEARDMGLTMINLPYTYTAEQAVHLRMIHPILKACYLPDSIFMDLLAGITEHSAGGGSSANLPSSA
jgi:hypothetical protein